MFVMFSSAIHGGYVVLHHVPEISWVVATWGAVPNQLWVASRSPACCPQVHLARLVVLGWTMDMGPSACVLAAALSLTPSCDVFLTPMNTQGARDAARLQHQWLRHVFKERTSHFFFNQQAIFCWLPMTW